MRGVRLQVHLWSAQNHAIGNVGVQRFVQKGQAGKHLYKSVDRNPVAAHVNGNWVCVAITDNISGIPGHVRGRLQLQPPTHRRRVTHPLTCTTDSTVQRPPRGRQSWDKRA
jgi:hypothetical protein